LKAHRLVYRSTPGWRVIKKKKGPGRPPRGTRSARSCTSSSASTNTHGARPVHLIIITMIKWTRTSRWSIKNTLFLDLGDILDELLRGTEARDLVERHQLQLVAPPHDFLHRKTSRSQSVNVLWKQIKFKHLFVIGRVARARRPIRGSGFGP